MSVIVKPIITEKMTVLSDKLQRYGFIVDKKANKLTIKKAIESLYDVTVESVNTMNYRGDRVGRWTKSGYIAGKKNVTKKAIVTLAKGETIDFYSNI
jgi:large subunit ribosomal protein L23